MTCFVNEAGSKIGNDWRSDRTQSFNRSLFGEAAYLVIRWVNFEKQLYQSPGQAPAPALMIKDGDTAKTEEEKIAAYRDGRMASTQGRRQPKAGGNPGNPDRYSPDGWWKGP